MPSTWKYVLSFKINIHDTVCGLINGLNMTLIEMNCPGPVVCRWNEFTIHYQSDEPLTDEQIEALQARVLEALRWGHPNRDIQSASFLRILETRNEPQAAGHEG